MTGCSPLRGGTLTELDSLVITEQNAIFLPGRELTREGRDTLRAARKRTCERQRFIHEVVTPQ
jgi:hypothetical protein